MTDSPKNYLLFFAYLLYQDKTRNTEGIPYAKQDLFNESILRSDIPHIYDRKICHVKEKKHQQ